MNGVEFTNDVAEAPPAEDPGRVTVPDVAGGADEEIALQEAIESVSPAMQAFDDTIERDPRAAYQHLNQTVQGLLTKLARLKAHENIDDPTQQREYKMTAASLAFIATGFGAGMAKYKFVQTFPVVDPVGTHLVKPLAKMVNDITTPLQDFLTSKFKSLSGQIGNALGGGGPSTAGSAARVARLATYEDALRWGGDIPADVARQIVDHAFGARLPPGGGVDATINAVDDLFKEGIESGAYSSAGIFPGLDPGGGTATSLGSARLTAQEVNTITNDVWSTFAGDYAASMTRTGSLTARETGDLLRQALGPRLAVGADESGAVNALINRVDDLFKEGIGRGVYDSAGILDALKSDTGVSTAITDAIEASNRSVSDAISGALTAEEMEGVLRRSVAGFTQGSEAMNGAMDSLLAMRTAAAAANSTASMMGKVAEFLPAKGTIFQVALLGATFGLEEATDGTDAGRLGWAVGQVTLGGWDLAKMIGSAAIDDSTPAGQLRKADYNHSMRLYTSDQERQADKTHAPSLPRVDFYDDPTMSQAMKLYQATPAGADHLKALLGTYGNMILGEGTRRGDENPGRKNVTLDDMVDKFTTYSRGKIWNMKDIKQLSRRFFAPSFLANDPTEGGRQTDKWTPYWHDLMMSATPTLRDDFGGTSPNPTYGGGPAMSLGGTSMANDEMMTAYLIGSMVPQLFVQHATAALSNGLFQRYATTVLQQTLYRPIPNMTANDYVRPTASPWFADAAKGLASNVPPPPPGVSLPAWDPNINAAIYKIVSSDPDFKQRQHAGSTTDWVGFYNQNKQRILSDMARAIQDTLHQQAADHITDRLPRFASIVSSSPGVFDVAHANLMAPDPVAGLLPTATNAGAGIRIAIDPETRMRVADLTTCAVFSKLAYVNFVGDGLHPEWASMIHQGWSIPLAVQGGAFGEHRAVLTYHTGDNTLVVAFRGTVGPSLQGAGNWFKNLQAWKRTLTYSKTGIAQHEAMGADWAKDRRRFGVARGFWVAWKDLRDKLLGAFYRMFQAPHMKRNFRPRVLITGHSLGSAMAACCLLELPPEAKPIYYGFGTPRVGDETFTRVVHDITDGQFYRLANAHDPVTHVPPKVFGFKHAGTAMQFLPENNGLFKYFDDTDDDKTYHDSVGPSAANHDMKLYESNTQIVARNTPSQLYLHRTQEFAHYFEPRKHVFDENPDHAPKMARLLLTTARRIGRKREFSAISTQLAA